jgi:hypothetical protein
MIIKLSGGTINEKPVEGKKSALQSRQRSSILFLMVLSRRRSPTKIVKIIGQKLRLEQYPKENSKDFGRICKKFRSLTKVIDCYD